jgi:hypothetical protein
LEVEIHVFVKKGKGQILGMSLLCSASCQSCVLTVTRMTRTDEPSGQIAVFSVNMTQRVEPEENRSSQTVPEDAEDSQKKDASDRSRQVLFGSVNARPSLSQ